MATTVDRFHNSHAKEFVRSRGYHDITAVKQLTIVFMILDIAKMGDVFAITLPRLFELFGLFVLGITGQNQIKGKINVVKAI